MSYDQRVSTFKELLAETKIDAFTPYKRVQPLLVSDPRYKSCVFFKLFYQIKNLFIFSLNDRY